MADKSDSPPCSILLIEDHVDTVRALSAILRRMGHAVVAADSVEAAVREVVARHFDVIISDVGLPDGSGVSLMTCIRPFCKAPAIAYTGYASPDDVHRCKEAGFDLHLAKPADFEQLRDAIRHVRSAKPGSQAQPEGS